MHRRGEIKQAVLSILMNKTDVINNVFPNRFIPIAEAELPCICVYALSEPTERYDNIRLKRTLDLMIECICKNDQMADKITNQVEYLMVQDVTLGKNVSNSELRRTDIGVDEQSKNDTLSAKMLYEVIYFTEETADPGNIDLKTIDINYGGEIKDSVVLP